MTPSPYQQAIFDFITSGSGSAIINAVAGSGKTTTIVEAAKLLRPGGTNVFLAFNKSIATELQSRLPYYVQAATFHSTCLAAFRKTINPKVKIDAAKSKWLAQDNALIPERDFWKIFPYIEKLVSFAKCSTLQPQDVDFSAVVDHHDLDDPPANAFSLASKLLELSFADTTRVDFDDMLWLTWHHNARFMPPADFVFVDEAQDLSGIQHALLTRMLKPSGRLIAVGDRHQAIYGFRGAECDGMDMLRDAFNATELPLSVSYRCSKAVVAHANNILAAPAGRP
jgi:superfamily I DNA/RNA helicase